MPSNSRTAVPLSANCTCRIICLSSAYVIQVSASGMTIWRKYSALLPGIQHFRLCRLRCRPFSPRQDLPLQQCPRLLDFQFGQGAEFLLFLFSLFFKQGQNHSHPTFFRLLPFTFFFPIPFLSLSP